MLALILIIFVLGYAAIAFEHPLRVNKAASALLTGVICWTIFAIGVFSGAIGDMMVTLGHGASSLMPVHGGEEGIHHVTAELGHHLDEIAQILFFLIGAMTIVELVDIHGGFEVITKRINMTKKVTLLWTVSLITFFLSAALDNLTTSIVMVSLLSKLMTDRKDRLLFAGVIVIAANAGGAWSPIGDVTTTMLWIDEKISAGAVIGNLIIPSLISLVVPLLILTFTMKGSVNRPEESDSRDAPTSGSEKVLVLVVGVLGLVMVPVYKVLTHLPPYLGMMLSLGILWVVTEIMNKNKTDKFKSRLSPSHALERIDTPSVLFFLGILLAVGVLQTSGLLNGLAEWLDANLQGNTRGGQNIIVLAIGALSSIVDNVPLVKGAIGMYSYEMDHPFWEFLAYAAGTGGSILIIGSAAGVAVMGIEKVDFFWYLKRISLLAIVGYLAGAGAYLLLF